MIDSSCRAQCHVSPPLKLIYILLLLTHRYIYIQDSALDLFTNFSLWLKASFTCPLLKGLFDIYRSTHQYILAGNVFNHLFWHSRGSGFGSDQFTQSDSSVTVHDGLLYCLWHFGPHVWEQQQTQIPRFRHRLYKVTLWCNSEEIQMKKWLQI